jgi:hypothetical protein
MLLGLADEDRHTLLKVIQAIETILDAKPKPPASYCCDPSGPAIWAGSYIGMASSTRKNLSMRKLVLKGFLNQRTKASARI